MEVDDEFDEMDHDLNEDSSGSDDDNYAEDTSQNDLKSNSENEYDLENEEVSSIDDENDDEEDKRLENEIEQLQNATYSKPYDYDSHVKLIELCKIAGQSRPDQLRAAREHMSKLYPLTPKMWLDWIKDEKDLLSSSVEEQNEGDENNNNIQRILNLFERAIQDYLSIDVWIEYQQFVLDSGLENVDIIKIYEQALASVGLHPIRGHDVWKIYRMFEKTLLSDEFEEDKEKQLQRVFKLFQRELSIPNLQLDTTYEEFQNWLNEIKNDYPTIKFDCSSIESLYKKSKAEFEKIRSFEERLAKVATLDCYYEYLDYEIKQKNPTRVQFLFERAITDHCLISDLWMKYLKYLHEHLNFYETIIVALKRALRNVTWCSDIWIEYIRTIERFDRPDQEALELFEQSLKFLTEDDNRKVWLCYLEYRRRKTDFNDLKQIDKLRKNFDVCIENLSKMYNADPYFTVSIFQAKIEAKFCSNIAKSREIWNEIMKYHNNLGIEQVNFWLEYATLEKYYGDQDNYKKVMLKALNYCPESFDLLSNQLIRHFKEESNSIKEIDAVERSVLAIFDRIVKKYREKEEKMSVVEVAASNEKKFNKPQKQQQQQQEIENRMEISGKGVKRKENESIDLKTNNNKKLKQDDQKQVAESNQSSTEFKKPPSSDIQKLNTVIVKNLSYKLTEEAIREEFSKFGTIKDVRLVKNYKGQSKGFCYIEFSSIEEVKNAVRNDRMLIDERPAFISEIDKNPEFKFKNELEKNKLFVSKLSPKTTQAKLREIYSKFEGFKEVRLNTFRNGHSKGNAYVEFKRDVDASNALIKTDGQDIDGQKIKVQLSNPPKKKDKEDEKALGDAVFKKPLGIGRAKPKLRI